MTNYKTLSLFLEISFHSLKGLIPLICHQTAAIRCISFHIAVCYRYFSDFPLFTRDFIFTLLLVTNFNISFSFSFFSFFFFFNDYDIHDVPSGTRISLVHFTTSETLNSIIFHPEYHTLYLNLNYYFISSPTNIQPHWDILCMNQLVFHCCHHFVLSLPCYLNLYLLVWHRIFFFFTDSQLPWIFPICHKTLTNIKPIKSNTFTNLIIHIYKFSWMIE